MLWKRIIQKRGSWNSNWTVYDKWIDRLPREANLGYKYWSMWVLAVVAMKCGILQEELEHDAFELIDAVDEKDANLKEKKQIV